MAIDPYRVKMFLAELTDLCQTKGIRLTVGADSLGVPHVALEDLEPSEEEGYGYVSWRVDGRQLIACEKLGRREDRDPHLVYP